MCGAGEGHGEDALRAVEEDNVTAKLSSEDKGVDSSVRENDIALQGRV